MSFGIKRRHIQWTENDPFRRNLGYKQSKALGLKPRNIITGLITY